MPSHIYHLLQLLDVGAFGPLEDIYRKFLEEIIIASNNYINKEDFLSSIHLHTKESLLRRISIVALLEQV